MFDVLTTSSDPGTSERVRVAVADNRRLIADALAALIRTLEGFEVTDVFSDDAQLPQVLAHDPAVVMIGTATDLSSACKLVRSLRQLDPRIEIVILADVLSRELVRLVLDARLSGLILTDTPAGDLAACLGRIASGHAVLPAEWQTVLATPGADPVGSLSDRQLEVLVLAAEGHSYEEIGRRLFISANTVKFHLRSIYLRLGVRNRMAAARMLSEHGAPEASLLLGSDKQTHSQPHDPRRSG